MMIQQNPKIVSRKMGSQWIILEENKKYVRQLNSSAGQIWSLAQKPISVDQIVVKMAKLNKRSVKDMESDTMEFIHDYLKDKLFIKL